MKEMRYIIALRSGILLLMVCGWLMLSAAAPAYAQTPVPPVATPDPIQEINKRLDEQKARLEALENPTFKWSDVLTWLGQTGAGLLGILGGGVAVYKFAVNRMNKAIDEKTKTLTQQFDERLKQAIYRVDPSVITVWIEPDLRQLSRLDELGFKDVKDFELLSLHGPNTRYMAGVMVCKAKDLADIRAIYEQLQRRSLADGRLGVVFCSERRIDGVESVIQGALPYSFANLVATVSINIINVAQLVNLRLTQNIPSKTI